MAEAAAAGDYIMRGRLTDSTACWSGGPVVMGMTFESWRERGCERSALPSPGRLCSPAGWFVSRIMQKKKATTAGQVSTKLISLQLAVISHPSALFSLNLMLP